MPQITQLDNDPTPNNNDLLVTVDMAAGTTKNISREQFFTGAPLPADTVDTQSIADQAVTADKIDFATYTTSEKVVGTWIDGKPIYRRTFTGTITQEGSTRNVRTLFNQPGDMINSYGYFVSGSAQFKIGETTGNDSLTTVYKFSYITHSASGDYNVTTRSDVARTNEPFQITFEYTKP